MGPRDRLRARLGGSTCAACGTPVRDDGVRLLAHRDEIIFLELACLACGSEGLAIETLPAAPDEGVRWTDGPSFGEFGPVDEVRFAGARPIVADDVLAVHRFLTGYRGSLGRLIVADGLSPVPPRPSLRQAEGVGGRPG